MKKSLLIYGIGLTVISCKKDRTSYWQVNNEGFSSKDVRYGYSPGGTSLSTTSKESGFSIMMTPGGELPKGGSMPISMPYNGGGGAQVAFIIMANAIASLLTWEAPPSVFLPPVKSGIND